VFLLAWEPWYPSASVQGGGVIFVFDQEDCMHAPPKSDCKYFAETPMDGDEHWETIKAIVPMAGERIVDEMAEESKRRDAKDTGM
jgi:hypothetical protein